VWHVQQMILYTHFDTTLCTPPGQKRTLFLQPVHDGGTPPRGNYITQKNVTQNKTKEKNEKCSYLYFIIVFMELEDISVNVISDYASALSSLTGRRFFQH
jgi:hypothetical protein